MDILKLEASEMEEGENRYLTCPSCGRNRKLSISIIDGRAVFHCFRPSCNLYTGGAFNVNGSTLVRTRTQEKVKKIEAFDGEITYLDDEWIAYLNKEVGFEAHHLEIGRPMYAVEEDRVAYPIFSPLGRRRGWVLRSYHNSDTKTLTRMDADEPHMSWYVNFPDQPLVVVEDIPSAIRIAKYANAVALCGTGCGIDYAHELSAHTRKIVWALDADVLGQSIRLDRRYGILFESSNVLPIRCDFKNMTEAEIRRALYWIH